MPSFELLKQLHPFSSAGTQAGVTLDGVGNVATVTGANTLTSQAFALERLSAFSFAIQYGASVGTAVNTGAFANGWSIQGCNDYDPNRPAQFPGSWEDINASLLTATKPFADVPAAIGANTKTHYASWTCPFGAVRFVFSQSAGTTNVTAQFVAKSI